MGVKRTTSSWTRSGQRHHPPRPAVEDSDLSIQPLRSLIARMQPHTFARSTATVVASMSASSWFVVAIHVHSRQIQPRKDREESMPSLERAGGSGDLIAGARLSAPIH